MVELVDDVLIVLPVLFRLKVAKHCEEYLSREHWVTAGLMHVSFPHNSEEFSYSLEAAIESDLSVDERFNVEEFWEEVVDQ